MLLLGLFLPLLAYLALDIEDVTLKFGLSGDHSDLYRRYGASTCVTGNFTEPEVQHRLHAALMEFPRSDVVRNLIHKLVLPSRRRRGVSRFVTAYSDRWYFTARGESRIEAPGERVACVAIGGVRVRDSAPSDYDGERQLDMWMKRTSWKITDGYFRRMQLKAPTPLYLPYWVEAVVERFRLEHLAIRLQSALTSIATWFTNRLSSYLTLASNVWARVSA